VAEVPATPGKSAVEMFEAAADGEIKACGSPAPTRPSPARPGHGAPRLQRAEFVVVQEAFATTATCAYADLLLPATTWGEKLGTVTNSERRISRVRAAVAPAGQARHDWAIGVQLARRLEARLRPGRPALFPYTCDAEAGVEAIWNEHRESTRGRDLDITGLSYALLERRARSNGPARRRQGRAGAATKTALSHPDGRARFAPSPTSPWPSPQPLPVQPDTGRLRDQWHGMSRTGRWAPVRPWPEPRCSCTRRTWPSSWAEGDLVRVQSRRRHRAARASAGCARPGLHRHALGPGVPERLDAQGEALAGVNALTPSLLPELQAARAQARRRAIGKPACPGAAGHGLAAEDEALAARERSAAAGRVPFSACVLFGSPGAEAEGRCGLLLRAAATRRARRPAGPHRACWAWPAEALRYADAQGQRRALRLQPRGDGCA
jgi:assimilatory nitrate reductase catalytic subunit